MLLLLLLRWPEKWMGPQIDTPLPSPSPRLAARKIIKVHKQKKSIPLEYCLSLIHGERKAPRECSWAKRYHLLGQTQEHYWCQEEEDKCKVDPSQARLDCTSSPTRCEPELTGRFCTTAGPKAINSPPSTWDTSSHQTTCAHRRSSRAQTNTPKVKMNSRHA